MRGHATLSSSVSGLILIAIPILVFAVGAARTVAKKHDHRCPVVSAPVVADARR